MRRRWALQRIPELTAMAAAAVMLLASLWSGPVPKWEFRVATGSAGAWAFMSACQHRPERRAKRGNRGPGML